MKLPVPPKHIGVLITQETKNLGKILDLANTPTPITTVPADAPISLSMRSPTRESWSIHPASFQPVINGSPHSSCIIACTCITVR
jgi:hypothetical protein